ncbi:protein kinase [Nocardia sp. NPDC057668]|uniref:serine/threonine-protein kinase n=1 Tax=Nocardia sp. NPDC057668 TaxID=3346202 RepID=UPI00366E5134
MLNSGDVFAGFTVERLLGQGGMGSVYLARHPRLGRLTALKLLNRELFADREIRARFEREADLVAQLDHPNIVEVYDRGSENEQLWISMQYVDGVDAASVNVTQLPPERAVQIIEGVAAALDYANSMGVLHRDVKPANIILARAVAGHGERVFLSDFGIARLREDSTHLTQAGMFTATLAYASPEQMTGAPLDHATDQYSLACALYWLLIGMGPYDSPHPTELIRGHLQLLPPPVSLRRPGLTPAMDAVLTKAMAKRPADRFPTSTDFAKAARRALAPPGTPVPPYLGPVYAPAPPAYPAQPPAYAPYPPPYPAPQNYPPPPNPQSPQGYPPQAPSYAPAYPALVPAPHPAQPALPAGHTPQPAGHPQQPAGFEPQPAGHAPQPAGFAPQPAGPVHQPGGHPEHPAGHPSQGVPAQPPGTQGPQGDSPDQRTDLLARPDSHAPDQHPGEFRNPHPHAPGSHPAGPSSAAAAGQVTDAVLYAESPPASRTAESERSPAHTSGPLDPPDSAVHEAKQSSVQGDSPDSTNPSGSDGPAEPAARAAERAAVDRGAVGGDVAANAPGLEDVDAAPASPAGINARSGGPQDPSGYPKDTPAQNDPVVRAAGNQDSSVGSQPVDSGRTARRDPDSSGGSDPVDSGRIAGRDRDSSGGSDPVDSGRTARPDPAGYPGASLRNPMSGAFVPSAGVGAAAGRYESERVRPRDTTPDAEPAEAGTTSPDDERDGHSAEAAPDAVLSELDSPATAVPGSPAAEPETPHSVDAEPRSVEPGHAPPDSAPGSADFVSVVQQHVPPGVPSPEFGAQPPGGAYGPLQTGPYAPNGAPPQGNAGWRNEVDRTQVNALVVSGLAVLVLALMLLILAVMVLG